MASGRRVEVSENGSIWPERGMPICVALNSANANNSTTGMTSSSDPRTFEACCLRGDTGRETMKGKGRKLSSRCNLGASAAKGCAMAACAKIRVLHLAGRYCACIKETSAEGPAVL